MFTVGNTFMIILYFIVKQAGSCKNTLLQCTLLWTEWMPVDNGKNAIFNKYRLFIYSMIVKFDFLRA